MFAHGEIDSRRARGARCCGDVVGARFGVWPVLLGAVFGSAEYFVSGLAELHESVLSRRRSVKQFVLLLFVVGFVGAYWWPIALTIIAFAAAYYAVLHALA